ncbi:hypothetical protein Syn8016DRAFT_1131 [Synechococcus sp. WH 8016]|nr:hypothetical protein Syn8016DRAFT_1131 [Synechococcus sp. WH 8016]
MKSLRRLSMKSLRRLSMKSLRRLSMKSLRRLSMKSLRHLSMRSRHKQQIQLSQNSPPRNLGVDLISLCVNQFLRVDLLEKMGTLCVALR